MANKSPKHTIHTKIYMPTVDQARDVFDEYAAAVGRVAHTWNYLHEKLGELFIILMKPEHEQVAGAVWHSTYNDRAQREMLRCAAIAALACDWKNFPAAKDDIIWLLNRTNDLSIKRDDAIHAPTMLIGTKEPQMMSSALSQHRRARNLAGKKLLIEFDWCAEHAEALSRFSIDVAAALKSGNTWPGIPPLPKRRQKRQSPSPLPLPLAPK